MNHFKRDNCRGCHGKDLKLWFSLGVQPAANNLLKTPIDNEQLFPLDVYYCLDCTLVQLLDVVNPGLLFDHYLYNSSTAPSFIKHFEDFAQSAWKDLDLKRGNLIIDIGSNDGILLKPFQKLGGRVLGIEPAFDIAQRAMEEGVTTITSYFNPKLAEQIVDQYGTAKVVTATNVFAHIDDLDAVLEGVKILLDTDGLFVIEVAYLPDMLNSGTFDLVYHEHLNYYTAHSLYRLLDNNGFSIHDIEPIPVHGGSIRVYASLKSGGITQFRDDEWILTTDQFQNFPSKIEQTKKDLTDIFRTLKSKGKTISGYGAPAKMSTMTNFFGIDVNIIDYIVDDSPFKQELYSPGKRIPIKNPGYLDIQPPDYIFIFAWNFAQPIIKKLKENGFKGKFIVPFPAIKVL